MLILFFPVLTFNKILLNILYSIHYGYLGINSPDGTGSTEGAKLKAYLWYWKVAFTVLAFTAWLRPQTVTYTIIIVINTQSQKPWITVHST